jgi:hypothetical protein
MIRKLVSQKSMVTWKERDMIATKLLAGTSEVDMQLIATVGLLIFALLTGLLWAVVSALRSIGDSLRQLAENAAGRSQGEQKE